MSIKDSLFLYCGRSSHRVIKNAGVESEGISVMVPNIDYSLCRGCGGCAEAYPMLFEMRDDKAWVINADTFKEKDREGIMTVCPYYAITIEDA